MATLLPGCQDSSQWNVSQQPELDMKKRPPWRLSHVAGGCTAESGQSVVREGLWSHLSGQSSRVTCAGLVFDFTVCRQASSFCKNHCIPASEEQ